MPLKQQLLGRKTEAKKTEDLAKRNRELEKRIEELTERIESLRKTNFRLPFAKKHSAPGSYCRVAIPDTHGCLVDKPSISNFLADLATIKPREIVMLGDHLECGGFLAQHHTLGYVAQNEYSFDEDCLATNLLLDEIQKRSPKAEVTYLEGNHERRIETWICTETQRHKKDGEFLRRQFNADRVLNLEKRNIRWIRQGEFYDNLSIPATIKKGHCYFTHGSSTAKHAASVHVSKFGGNVVYGHTHRADSFIIRNVKDGVIGAWSPGCLCVLQPLWQHTNPTDWSHGYGLQLVNPDGTFLHINVPIIDGKSYLAPLFKAVA
jgi:UDP-2,3-diacylglucosamine pyrophosphatase LpxH